MNRSSSARNRLAAFFAIAVMALPCQLVAEQVFPDPEGDLIGLDEGAPDATALIATDLGDALLLKVELTHPDMAAELTGLVEIDTSAGIEAPDPEAIGGLSRISLLCPKSTGLGVNRTLDLFARVGPDVPVRDSRDQVIGSALWEETGTGFSLTLDKNVMGLDTGLIGIAVIIGSPEEPGDCVPDGGEFTHAEIDLHRVIVESSAGTGGSIEPEGSIVADIDQSITFDLLPAPGHEIVSVDSSCGGTLNVNELTYTIDPVIESCNVAAMFEVNTYRLGGTVTGLSGSGLELELDAVESIAIDENGEFHFDTLLDHGTAWSVSVTEQPSDPSQTCTVSNGSFAGITSDFEDIQVSCITDTFTVGGTVSGLEGNGLVLRNNGVDDLPISADGNFTFTTELADGSDYDVTVLTQPTDPDQTCSVANASGTLGGTDVDDVIVNCSKIELGLSLEAVQFAHLGLDGRAEQAVVLTNVGEADLVLEEFVVPQAPFGFDAGDCTGLPRTLGPGDSCTVMLSFTPLTDGVFQDQLLIMSNAPASPHSVTLGGRGVLPAVPVPTLGPLAVLLLMLGFLMAAMRSSRT